MEERTEGLSGSGGVKKPFERFKRFFGSDGGHAQAAPGAGRAAVQAAWAAGKPRVFPCLNDLIVGTSRHEAPFRGCRAKKGDYRRSHAGGQMHGAGISGDQRVGGLQQGAGFTQ